MGRRRITQPLGVGIRAIDGLLTIGRGQRMGIFSGSGVGKSVLLGMISRFTAADVTVIGLIGERGREVRDFVERDLGPAGLAKSVVVVSTSDEPPLLRVQAGAVATAVAEYFRDRGADVLLLVDSLTRLATAQRQIGLVAGEPPATKGYTPSVFNVLPQLLERSGRTERGSITGFYTVLAEGDDPSEPISDATRAVTDGHIQLSRELANRGHWPAIDCLRSVSRVMIDLVDSPHRAAAAELNRLMTLYGQVEDMVGIGAYRSGANRDFDLAIQARPLIEAFLTQGIAEREAMDGTRAKLLELHKRIRDIRSSLQGSAEDGGRRTR
jgi:flagellum-specific ATP synthase